MQEPGRQPPIQRQSRIHNQTRTRLQTASQHRSGPSNNTSVSDEDEIEDEIWPPRLPTSVRRYNTAVPQVIEQGNRRFIIHDRPPPGNYGYETVATQTKERYRPHVLVFVGIALFIMIIGWIGFSALSTWWQIKQDDWTYGQNPRTFQIDAVVGHSDSSTNPSHFIAMNLHGTILVIELPGGNASKARSYTITTLPGNSTNPPVKILFQDLNGDGKLDMFIQIGDPGSVVTIMLLNNGQQFVPKL
jgi:hypothetical protein